MSSLWLISPARGVAPCKGDKKQKDTRAREMTEFIELTVFESGDKVLLPVRLITGVVEDEDGTFIETGMDGKGKETGVFVTESYESVKEKLL